MEDFDLKVRNITYRTFVEAGHPPTIEIVADSLHLSIDDVEQSWQRLHSLHSLVLEADGKRLRMANPFSAVPTNHRVRAAGRRWYANCAWDAFGICAALHVDGHISTSCPDCTYPLEIDVHSQQPSNSSLVFHSLVPAAQWWDDIVFT